MQSCSSAVHSRSITDANKHTLRQLISIKLYYQASRFVHAEELCTVMPLNVLIFSRRYWIGLTIHCQFNILLLCNILRYWIMIGHFYRRKKHHKNYAAKKLWSHFFWKVYTTHNKSLQFHKNSKYNSNKNRQNSYLQKYMKVENYNKKLNPKWRGYGLVLGPPALRI